MKLIGSNIDIKVHHLMDIDIGKAALCVAYSTKGHFIIIGTKEKCVLVTDNEKFEMIQKLNHHY